MTTYTEREYFSDVRLIAREAIRAEQHESVDVLDAIHESVDGSQWIIYHGRARFVCAVSQNEDAIFEHLGSDAFANVENVQQAITRAAYWAMVQDVYDVLDDVRAEIQVEDEKAADDA